MRPSAKLCALLSIASLIPACAAAPARRPSMAEESAAAAEPTSLPEAEAQLDRAYRQLGGSRAGVAGGLADQKERAPEPGSGKNTDKGQPPPPPAPVAESPKPADAAPRDDRAPKAITKKDSGADQPADEGSPCRQACRAYASLRRAVDAVCRLAGDPSDKCTSARDRQKEIEGRVTSCGCL